MSNDSEILNPEKEIDELRAENERLRSHISWLQRQRSDEIIEMIAHEVECKLIVREEIRELSSPRSTGVFSPCGGFGF